MVHNLTCDEGLQADAVLLQGVIFRISLVSLFAVRGWHDVYLLLQTPRPCDKQYKVVLRWNEQCVKTGSSPVRHRYFFLNSPNRNLFLCLFYSWIQSCCYGSLRSSTGHSGAWGPVAPPFLPGLTFVAMRNLFQSSLFAALPADENSILFLSTG